MNFKNFKIFSTTHVTDAYCNCGQTCVEVSNGLTSRALYCPSCESVYEIKMVKIPRKRLSKRYMDQCRKEAARRIKDAK